MNDKKSETTLCATTINDLVAYASRNLGYYPANRVALLNLNKEMRISSLLAMDIPEVSNVDVMARTAVEYALIDQDTRSVSIIAFDGPAQEGQMMDEREVPMEIEILMLALHRECEQADLNLADFYWVKDGVAQSVLDKSSLHPVHMDGMDGLMGTQLREVMGDKKLVPLPSPAKSLHKIVQKHMDILEERGEQSVYEGEHRNLPAMMVLSDHITGKTESSAAEIVAAVSRAGVAMLLTLPHVCSADGDGAIPVWENVERVENMVRKALPRAAGKNAAVLYAMYAWCRWVSGMGSESASVIELASQELPDLNMQDHFGGHYDSIHPWVRDRNTARMA